ncbi:MAG: type II secretion system F family protein [Nanoarchaeota archaeon]|nr:type II secretion system F family protein [Nanoarchaeota archaeon]MBU0977197.1 type II secretion system F family protein [Nanoarchaeota archaeon]
MIDELKKNIDTEVEMLREIASYINRYESAAEDEKKLLDGAINSLLGGMKIINDNIPELLRDITVAEKRPSKKESNLHLVKYKGIGAGVEVVLKKNDKTRFLKELNISDTFVKKIKRKDLDEVDKYTEFKASRGYLKIANRFCLGMASKAVRKGSFKDLGESLRKANMDILFESYVAMMYFTIFLAFVLSFFAGLFFIFFSASMTWPFFALRAGGYLTMATKLVWVPIVVPVLMFLGIYYYPNTEKQSIGGRIDQELPFAVIHMSAITGAGIEPTEIFRIIGLSREYPYLRKEIRKVLNQINLYGYDLTTALTNAAKTTPSEKLSELFSGLATSIASGTNLSEFFEKRSETLLLSYRLDRQKYTRLVETFLDIYISIVIAAPMVFLLLIIMMAISGLNVGLGPSQISILSVAAIAVLNVVFLMFLQMKQPAY